MSRVLVVYGGHGLSTEAAISELSGASVVQAFSNSSNQAEGFILSDNNIEELLIKAANFDLVFPVQHGKFGEDGSLQTLLDERSIKYIGSGAISSKTCFNKADYKNILDAHGIKTPVWKLVASFDEIGDFPMPYVLKPVEGGSSVDLVIVRTLNKDLDAAKKIFGQHSSLLLEEYIQGSEITVGILGREALPVIEIILPDNEVFDYERKYSGKTTEAIPPQTVSEPTWRKAQILALEIHNLMDCRHLSRTDMLVKGDELYVLETNTMPGLTINSLYPKMAEAAGYSMPSLVDKFVELALQ